MPWETWKRKKRRQKTEPEGRPPQPEEFTTEGLTGFVRNKRASDNEEMFANSLQKADIQFQFKRLIYTPYQIPGQNYELDFVLFEGIPQPVEIDDAWVHRTQDEQDQDAIRDTLIDDITKYWGWNQIMRIKVDTSWTQEDFDVLVEERF